MSVVYNLGVSGHCNVPEILLKFYSTTFAFSIVALILSLKGSDLTVLNTMLHKLLNLGF